VTSMDTGQTDGLTIRSTGRQGIEAAAEGGVAGYQPAGMGRYRLGSERASPVRCVHPRSGCWSLAMLKHTPPIIGGAGVVNMSLAPSKIRSKSSFPLPPPPKLPLGTFCIGFEFRGPYLHHFPCDKFSPCPRSCPLIQA
jgi:hypothetical protein